MKNRTILCLLLVVFLFNLNEINAQAVKSEHVTFARLELYSNEVTKSQLMKEVV